MRTEQENWLVFRLSALGDVLLTTGVLAHWNAARSWRFHVVTREAFAPVFSGNPVVDRVVAAADGDLRMPRLASWLRELAAEYRGWGLIDLHGVLRARLLGAMWRGPVLRYPKYGLTRRLFLSFRSEMFRSRLLSANVPQRYALAADSVAPETSALLPRLYLSAEERAWGGLLTAALPGAPSGADAGVRVALHPYAAHRYKSWPEANWRELIARLEGAGIPWVMLGRGEPLLPDDGRDMTNRTSLRESAAVLAACSVLVTGDSGPMHLASSVGTPVVGLFGPTTREWGFFPAGRRDIVLERDMPCRPWSLHGKQPCPDAGGCLAGIAPETVFAAVLRSLSGGAGG